MKRFFSIAALSVMSFVASCGPGLAYPQVINPSQPATGVPTAGAGISVTGQQVSINYGLGSQTYTGTINAASVAASGVTVVGNASVSGTATIGTVSAAAVAASGVTIVGNESVSGTTTNTGPTVMTGAISGTGLVPIYQTVVSVAALRTVNHNFASLIRTSGYYAAQDGGDGVYYMTSPTTGGFVDDGCKTIVASDGAVWQLVFNRTINILQCGAKGDGNTVTGAGTDNTTFIQTSITDAGAGGSIYIPNKVFRTTQINVPSNFTVQGGGAFQSILMANSAFVTTTGLVRLNGAGGPPTNIADIGIVGQNGGAGAASAGLYSVANGAFMHGLWVTGFAVNITLGSSDNFLYDSVSEQALSGGTGISITSTDVSVNNVETYADYVGTSVTATFVDGTIVMSNMRSLACAYAGWVINGAANVQLNNSSVGHNNNGVYAQAGIWVTNSTNVTISNFTAKLGGGTPSATGVGILASGNTALTVNGANVSYFFDGFQNTGGTQTIVSNSIFSNNLRRGIYEEGGDQVVISGNVTSFNGTSGSVVDAGIWDSNTAGFQVHNISGNVAIQGGGGFQDYGIYTILTNNAGSSGFTNVTGNTAKFAAVANLSTNGLVANIQTTGNQN